MDIMEISQKPKGKLMKQTERATVIPEQRSTSICLAEPNTRQRPSGDLNRVLHGCNV